MKVYVPHVPSRYDPVTQRRVPVFDLQPATEFGILTFLVDLSQEIRGTLDPSLFQGVKQRIDSMTEDDYLLCMGDPILNAAAIKYATDKLGKIKVLRWDKSKKEYYHTEVEL